jgi:hypothetical protein
MGLKTEIDLAGGGEPAATVNYRPFLSSERTPHNNNRKYVKKILRQEKEKLSLVLGGCLDNIAFGPE